MRRRDARAVTIRGISWHPEPAAADPPPADPPPAPGTDQEALERARYEVDAAKAEAAKIKQQLADLQKQLPTDEQRAKFAELLEKEKKAEEEKLKAEGNFNEWRQQINQRHEQELAAERNMSLGHKAQAEALEKELNDKLVGLEFSSAKEWFGENGKTVMIPEVAQSYFARHVEVEVVPGADGKPSTRRVIVKDGNGAVIVDPKTGRPMAFAAAIGEVINSHPQKLYLLRNSGKFGSGSTGGAGGGNEIDLTRLKPKDFENPAVRAKVREQQNAPGGMRIGPGFDKFRHPAGKS